MSIKMRRGDFADLDTTRLVGGEIAVTDDPNKVYVKTAGGDVIDLATQDDLQNVVTVEGAVTVNNGCLTFTPQNS